MSLIVAPDGSTSFSSPGEGMEVVALTRELRAAFGDSATSAAWMRTQSEFLDGRTPLATLREGRFGDMRRRLVAHLEGPRRAGIAEERSVHRQKELL